MRRDPGRSSSRWRGPTASWLPAEKDGILGATKVFNLTKETREKIESLVEQKTTMADLSFGDLTAREKAFAFVAASWLAGVDEDVDPKEAEALEELARRLGLTVGQVAELATLSEKLEPLPEGKRSWSGARRRDSQGRSPRASRTSPPTTSRCHLE